MNTLIESKTKEEFLDDYKNYPSVEGDLAEKPFYESRYAPIFYEIKPGSKVLDVGCNDGAFMAMLKAKRDCDVTGIDLSDVALDSARKKGLIALKMDIEEMSFPDGHFDVVTCMEVLSHLHDPGKALKEIRRVLKKGGVLLGSCPHKNLETFLWEDKRLHNRYYDENELHLALSKSFGRSWMKTLKGGQFAVALAGSFIGDQPAEILFKSGNNSVLGWDSALQDRTQLRCWMGFTQTPGTVYYRMSGFADKMQKMGAEVHYNPYNEADFNSAAEWQTKIRYLPSENRLTNAHIVQELETLLKVADLSVFQITTLRDILLVLTTARRGVVKKPMWAEIDDWIWDVPSYNMAATPYQPNSEAEDVAFQQVTLSDGVITSTEYLKTKIETLFPGKRVYVIKNALDFDIWDNLDKSRPLHEANPDLIRIGYTGCSNHSGDLELIVEPMKALLDEFPNLEFTSLPYPSTDGITSDRYKRVNKWVAMSMFPQEVASWELDIGIAPLRDNELNRAKSNLRWLEYSALKVPTIASRVYPFQNSIKSGKDGIVVGNSAVEWYEAMKGLIVEKGKRTAIGEAAYKNVRKNYDMDKVAKSYLSVLKEIKRDFLADEGKKAANA